VYLGALTALLVHPTSPALLTKEGPLEVVSTARHQLTQAAEASRLFKVWE